MLNEPFVILNEVKDLLLFLTLSESEGSSFSM